MNATEGAVERCRPIATSQVLRTTFRIVVPTIPVCLIVGTCAAIIPPWPVVVALSVGFTATVGFVVARKPAIGITVAVVSFAFCIWWLRPIVDVRAATATDRTYERYFGIYSHEEDVVVTIRNIGIARGTFTLRTWMSAWLYHVNDGGVQEINAFTVGRSPNQLGAPHWVDTKLTLALGDRDTSAGRITQLGAAGHSRGSGRGGELTHDVVASATRFLPGYFTPGEKRVVYVEGDSGFRVNPTMSVADFAADNKGNYLVVELELH